MSSFDDVFSDLVPPRRVAPSAPYTPAALLQREGLAGPGVDSGLTAADAEFADLVPARRSDAAARLDLAGTLMGAQSSDIDRSWEEVVDDTALAVRRGARNMVGGLIGAPVGVANLLAAPPAQRMVNAAAEKAGLPVIPTLAEILTGSAALAQPELVQGMRESLTSQNAQDAAQWQSDKARAQELEFQNLEGFLPTLGYLANNPSAAALLGAEQVPQLALGVPGTVRGTIALQALGAGGQNEANVAQELAEQVKAGKITQARADELGANVFAASTGLNAALPFLPGAQTLERLAANRAASVPAGQMLSHVFAGGLGEAAQGAIGEAGDEIIGNLATGKPWSEGAGRAAALGALLEGPIGAGAGAVEGYAGRLQRGSAPGNDEAIVAPAPAPAPAPDLAQVLASAIQPEADPAPTAPVASQASALSELDALLLASADRAEASLLEDGDTDIDAATVARALAGEPIAPTPFSGSATGVGGSQSLPALLANTPVSAVRALEEVMQIEQPGPAPGADRSPVATPATETVAGPEAPRHKANKVAKGGRPRHLVEVVATIGLDRDTWQAQGVDPAEFGTRIGINPLFRKRDKRSPDVPKGMTPSGLREFLQQEGYLPADHPDRPAEVDDNDAIDLFDRAWRGGQMVYSPDQQEAVAAWRQRVEAEDARAQAESEARMAADPAFAEFMRREQEGDYRGKLRELTDRAEELGATDEEVVSAAFDARDNAHHIELLQQLIQTIEVESDAYTGPGARGEGDLGANREGAGEAFDPPDDWWDGTAGGIGEPRSGYGDLFSRPSAREEVEAARRERDRRRDGRTGTGRTDMAAGDGELFAGSRPDQLRIDAAERASETGAGDLLRVEQPAFHGTPHNVDRFSLQKIGTGEGNQGFGWGLYFAGGREVADYYRTALSRNLREQDDQLADARHALHRALEAEDMLGFDTFGEAVAAIRSHPDLEGNWDLENPADLIAARDAYMQRLQLLQGNLYQVDVPEDHELLAYDLPLSEQSPRVQAAVRRVMAEQMDPLSAGRFTRGWDTRTGKEFYQALGRDLGASDDGISSPDDARLASEALNAAGVPGLRYLDGASRSKGEGAHNYVIWDEDAITTPDKIGERRGAASRDMFTRTRGDRQQAHGTDARADNEADRPAAAGGDRAGAAAATDGQRQDYSPELARRGTNAIDALVRRFGGTVLGDALARDFRYNDTASLIGREVPGSQDLAALAEVYRNPLFETLHYVFTDAKGVVVGETAVTSRMPASSAIMDVDSTPRDWIVERAKRFGAKNVWMLHNHPSGDPTPSNADVRVTRAIETELAGSGVTLMGHVVINHKQYAAISHSGEVSLGKVPHAETTDPLRDQRGVLIGRQVNTPNAVSALAAEAFNGPAKGKVAVIALDAKNRVSLATMFPVESMTLRRTGALLSQLAKRSGARGIIIAADSEVVDANWPALKRANDAGLAFEIVTLRDDGRPLSTGSEMGRIRGGATTDDRRTGSMRRRNAPGGELVFDAGAARRGSAGEAAYAGANKQRSPAQVAEEPARYNDAQAEFMRKAGLSEAVAPRTTMERMRQWLREVGPDLSKDTMLQSVFDQFHGIKRASELQGKVEPERDPYMAARLLNTASIMEAILRFGAPKLENGVLKVDRDVPGLLQALGPVARTMPQFLGWMVARRAQLLHSKGREALMSKADIAAGLSLAKGREQEFEQAAVDYMRLKNAILDLAEETGMVDPAARAAWDHAEYLPFYRQIAPDGEDVVTAPGTKEGIKRVSAGIKELKGGKDALEDPLGNIIRNFTRLVDSSMKNRAMTLAVDTIGSPYFVSAPPTVKMELIPLDQVRKHLIDSGVAKETVDAMPEAAVKGMQKMLAIKPPEGVDILRIMRAGKPEYYKVRDPLLLRSLNAFAEKPTHWAVKMMSWAKQLLTAGATSTPDFILRNWIRDTGEASITAKDRFIPVVDSVNGAVHAMRQSEAAQELMMAGSYFHSGLFRQGDVDDTAKAIRRALRSTGLSENAIKRYMQSVINPVKWWDQYRRVAEATEMGSRIALARRRLEAGATEVEAAFEAKDFLDFQMRGDSAITSFLIKTIPFLNARLQGLYRLGRVTTGKDRRAYVAAKLATLGTVSLALVWWNTMMYGEGYDELDDWDKDANWHIAPGTAYHIRIPKPFELGLLGGTLPERAYQQIRYLATGGMAGDRGAQGWDALMHAITQTLALNPVPQAVRPIIEAYVNYNMFFDSPIESKSDQYRPTVQRYSPASTSKVSRYLSKGIEAALGDENTLSPKKLDHIWRGYTAGMGMYVLDVADWFVDRVEGAGERPDAPVRDWPVVGALLRGDSPARSTRYTSELYRLSEDADFRSAAVKTALEDGDTARAARLEKEWGWLLGAREASKRAKGGFMHAGVREIDRTVKTLAGLRKEDARIYEDKQLSGAKKREVLDANAAKRNAEAKRLVQKIRERQRAAKN